MRAGIDKNNSLDHHWTIMKSPPHVWGLCLFPIVSDFLDNNEAGPLMAAYPQVEIWISSLVGHSGGDCSIDGGPKLWVRRSESCNYWIVPLVSLLWHPQLLEWIEEKFLEVSLQCMVMVLHSKLRECTNTGNVLWVSSGSVWTVSSSSRTYSKEAFWALRLKGANWCISHMMTSKKRRAIKQHSHPEKLKLQRPNPVYTELRTYSNCLRIKIQALGSSCQGLSSKPPTLGLKYANIWPWNMLTQTMLMPVQRCQTVPLTKFWRILFLSLQVFRAFYPCVYIVKQSSPNILLLFQLLRCHQELPPSELLKYANCRQGMQILSVKYAIYRQEFYTFWISNMLISRQTLVGASQGLKILCSLS